MKKINYSPIVSGKAALPIVVAFCASLHTGFAVPITINVDGTDYIATFETMSLGEALREAPNNAGFGNPGLTTRVMSSISTLQPTILEGYPAVDEEAESDSPDDNFGTISVLFGQPPTGEPGPDWTTEMEIVSWDAANIPLYSFMDIDSADLSRQVQVLSINRVPEKGSLITSILGLGACALLRKRSSSIEVGECLPSQ